MPLSASCPSSILTTFGIFTRGDSRRLDDTAFVAVRKEGNESYVAQNGYRYVHPAKWPPALDTWRENPALRASARHEAERAVTMAPAQL